MSPRPQLIPVIPPTSTSSGPASTSSTSTSSTATSTSTTSTTSTSSTSTTSTTSTSTISTTSTSISSTTGTTSTTSSTTSTSATSTSNTPTQSSTSAILITSSDGSVATSTTVVIVSPSVTSGTSGSSKTSTSKGFFQNTGAVAGVFTVVGIVALILFVALVTNAVRRRRAKKLDREIAEAAAEAAGTAPAFTDDDYYPDDRLPKGGPSGDVRSMTTTGYSDTTHGTFAQPPMSHGESYNMAELSSYDYSPAAGAAGIGAMGVNRARSMGNGNQTTPYNAFATPQPAMPNPYDDPAGAYGQQQNFGYRQRGPGGVPEMDLLDAAGLGAAGGAAAGYAAAHQAYGQPQNGGNLNRNPSLGPSTATSPSDYSSYGTHPPMPQGYQQDYSAYQPNQPAQYNAYQQGPPQGYAPQAAYAAVPPQHQTQQQTPETSSSPPRPLSMVSAADPYGGYVDEPTDSLPGYSSPPPQAGAHAAPAPPEKLLSGNFASPPASSEGHDHEDNRMSYQDEDDYGYEPKRVLKVANQ